MRTRKELKIARIRAGLSQYQVAALVGVSQQTIAKWELGITTPSHFSHLRALERSLDLQAEAMFPDIFTHSDDPDPDPGLPPTVAAPQRLSYAARH